VKESIVGEKVVIKGRVVNATTVALDEPLPEDATDVDVVVHLDRTAENQVQAMIDFLAGLPPGVRTKEDIDRQIEEERNSWRD
jgi:hypothetical protein